MSLSGDKGVAQFKKSVKMEHPSVYYWLTKSKKCEEMPMVTLEYGGFDQLF